MRCHYFVLLAVAAFLAGANVAVATTDAQLSDARGVRASFNTMRALRSHTEATDHGEERAYKPSLSVVESLNNWMQRASKNILPDDVILVMASKAMTKKTSSSDAVFAMLQLDQGLKGILSNPNLKQFAYYLVLTEKAPSQALITKLISQYGDDVVAKYLFDIKHKAINVSEKLKAEARFWQGAQYVKWFDEGVTPALVRQKYNVHPETWYKNPYEGVYWEYTGVYAKLASKSNKPLPVEV